MTSTRVASASPVTLFKTKRDWAAWLEKAHARSTGLWLRIAKKGASVRSVSYEEALETALCYGWIDAQKKPESEDCWLQRFVPRSSKSIWSKRNREKAMALMASGEMKTAGLKAIEEAKRNGRWDAAYDSPARAAIPEDLQAALDANPKAGAFFTRLNKTNQYAILWRIQTVKKPETRARKIQQFVAMCEREEKIH